MLSNWAYINYHHQSILFVTSFATNGSYCSIHMWFLSPGCLFSCFSLLLVASRDATVCLPVGAAMLWCSMWSALGFWWVCCRGFANLFLFGLVLARFASLVVSIMAYGSDTLLGFALCWALDFLPQLLLCFCMASLVVSLIRGCFLCLVPFMHLALVFSIGQGCLGRHLGCCERWILTNIANIYNCYFQVEWFSCACWTPCLGFFWGGGFDFDFFSLLVFSYLGGCFSLKGLRMYMALFELCFVNRCCWVWLSLNFVLEVYLSTPHVVLILQSLVCLLLFIWFKMFL